MTDPEDLVLWPDGTVCFRFELAEMRYMGDDYEIIPFGTDRYEFLLRDYE